MYENHKLGLTRDVRIACWSETVANPGAGGRGFHYVGGHGDGVEEKATARLCGNVSKRK